MIITRSPLRITLGGGGTDLPSYYREHDGFLIAAAIDKYVYVTVMRPFSPGIFLKYSKLEHIEQASEVQQRKGWHGTLPLECRFDVIAGFSASLRAQREPARPSRTNPRKCRLQTENSWLDAGQREEFAAQGR